MRHGSLQIVTVGHRSTTRVSEPAQRKRHRTISEIYQHISSHSVKRFNSIVNVWIWFSTRKGLMTEKRGWKHMIPRHSWTRHVESIKYPSSLIKNWSIF